LMFGSGIWSGLAAEVRVNIVHLMSSLNTP
jgi:hypothetical protein